jgi:Protein of unknown function (DUF2877)
MRTSATGSLSPNPGADPATRIVGVSRLGESAARRLAAGPRVIGRVHSVFERAVNLLGSDGRLLTLHGPGPLAAPFAVALDERLPWRELEPGLEPGVPVHREGRGRLVLGALRLDCSAAQVVDTSIGTGSDPSALAAALAEAPRSPAAPSLASGIALEGRRRLADGLRCGDADRFVDGARRLIGLGEGLTPAGDDLLVGSLAVARRFRPDFLLDDPGIGQALANAAREGTTIVAREFLLEALEGRFSEIVIALLTAADVPRARAALDDLLGLGASSGADTAAGMRLALDALY